MTRTAYPRFRNVLLTGALVALGGACKQKSAALDVASAFRKDDKHTAASGPGPASSAPPGGGNASVPTAYLLDGGDADKLRPIVEPYRTPTFKEGAGNYTQGFEPYRRFAEQFLNQAMGLTPLAPGRKIKVHIADDPAVNAFAGPFQDVTINSGTINAADSTQLLAVLCHELAHSARNHSMKTADFESAAEMSGALAKFDDARDAYLKKSYDEATHRYVHDYAAYKAVLKLWQAVEPRLGKFTKRQESEADILGSEICGHMGMPFATYAGALYDFLTTGDEVDAHSGGTMMTADQLADGDSFKLDREGLSGFLFSEDSHPTNAERRDQLGRVQAVAAPHFDAQATLFNDWRKGYKGASAGLGLVGLSLTDAVRAGTRTVTTQGGRTLIIKRRHLCGKP